jgi:predicted alpha-1,6-mannanase (GH76 family)
LGLVVEHWESSHDSQKDGDSFRVHEYIIADISNHPNLITQNRNYNQIEKKIDKAKKIVYY